MFRDIINNPENLNNSFFDENRDFIYNKIINKVNILTENPITKNCYLDIIMIITDYPKLTEVNTNPQAQVMLYYSLDDITNFLLNFIYSEDDLNIKIQLLNIITNISNNSNTFENNLALSKNAMNIALFTEFERTESFVKLKYLTLIKNILKNQRLITNIENNQLINNLGDKIFNLFNDIDLNIRIQSLDLIMQIAIKNNDLFYEKYNIPDKIINLIKYSDPETKIKTLNIFANNFKNFPIQVNIDSIKKLFMDICEKFLKQINTETMNSAFEDILDGFKQGIYIGNFKNKFANIKLRYLENGFIDFFNDAQMEKNIKIMENIFINNINEFQIKLDINFIEDIFMNSYNDFLKEIDNKFMEIIFKDVSDNSLIQQNVNFMEGVFKDVSDNSLIQQNVNFMEDIFRSIFNKFQIKLENKFIEIIFDNIFNNFKTQIKTQKQIYIDFIEDISKASVNTFIIKKKQ